jgi:hypothetical protein
MARLRICLEIDGFAEDENGYPCAAGMQMDFGDCGIDVPYKELTKNVNIPELLRIFCLETVPVSAVRIITPKEYDERYGDDE